VQKTRRGLNKSLEGSDQTKGQETVQTADSPKIIFRPMKMKHHRSPSIEELEELSPEYLEIVNFVNLGWSSVKNELEQDNTTVKYYQEKSNPKLADFSPFDLDAWWGKRLYQNLTNGL